MPNQPSPPAQQQHAALDQAAHLPDRPAGAGVQAGHQAIARARAELGADVQAGGKGDQQHAGAEHRQLPAEADGRRQQPQPELRGRADQQHVEHGADARLLPQWPPQQQHQSTDHVGGEAERKRGLCGDTL
ncbi:hypothetical protein G6F68_009646 [Rhizopus microsporus]|nr:hypothetical protein G6F68_009646 [Rhizopus microsporus]